MIQEVKKCDIVAATHDDTIETISIDVIFDHDQEDGKSKRSPYLDRVQIEICTFCKNFMLENRRYIYAYGAMGHNKYYLDK